MSPKIFRGLNEFSQYFERFGPWVEKTMASDLDGLRWRPLLRNQLWTLWAQDSIEATWCTSVEAFVPIYSWVSSAYRWKDTRLLVFDRSEQSHLLPGACSSYGTDNRWQLPKPATFITFEILRFIWRQMTKIKLIRCVLHEMTSNSCDLVRVCRWNYGHVCALWRVDEAVSGGPYR